MAIFGFSLILLGPSDENEEEISTYRKVWSGEQKNFLSHPMTFRGYATISTFNLFCFIFQQLEGKIPLYPAVDDAVTISISEYGIKVTHLSREVHHLNHICIGKLNIMNRP